MMHQLRKDLTFKEYCIFLNRIEKSPSKHWHGAESNEPMNNVVDRLFNRAADFIDWKLSERDN